MKLYRLDDSKQVKGVFECTEEEAIKYNLDGWGIFFTPNTFNGRRVRENLVKINSWFVDIDECDKETCLRFIMRGALLPSRIVETKRGYHCYWFSKDASPELFNEVQERLVDYYGADKGAKDITRILRVPGYYHCKDPDNHFLIDEIYTNDVIYSEKKMLFAYKAVEKPVYEYDGEIDINNIDLNRLLKPHEITRGERNTKIFKKGVFLKKIGAGQHQVDEYLHWLNNAISDPIPEGELRMIIRGYNSWT